ncbi:Cytochrome b5 reductase 4 [Portunus trituberculatus]|uniref:Cytochrome b5 reductase 4 n=1 Tax=Portunus trituberculatus TaxID=210409 RepID=A0A5B7GXK0_PORTR|nr:Cytochrome b5 reductase 4 [Portunus trituberculatus]
MKKKLSRQFGSLPREQSDLGTFLVSSPEGDSEAEFGVIEYVECTLVRREAITHNTSLLVLQAPDHTRLPVPVGYHVYLRSPNKAPPYHASQQAFEYTSASRGQNAHHSLPPVQNNNSVRSSSSSLTLHATKMPCNVA